METPTPRREIQRRLELHDKLLMIPGVAKVYYQPPENLKMVYPAIRYEKSGGIILQANDRNYIGRQRYQIFVIDADPDSCIASDILKAFSLCTLDRTYRADNLNHDVLTLYW